VLRPRVGGPNTNARSVGKDQKLTILNIQTSDDELKENDKEDEEPKDSTRKSSSSSVICVEDPETIPILKL
jgi:hypothetical protein